MATFAILGVVAALMTWGLYVNNARLNTKRVRKKVLAIATTAAPLFSASDISVLHSEHDIARREYARVVETLDTIRKENEGLKYVYIIRPTDEVNMFEFAADSYGLDLDKGIDFNNDGILGEEDEIPVPGMPYDVSEIPALQKGVEEPSADEEPFSDQWGTFISGFAPIKDNEGNTVAVLGVDRIANDVQELTFGTFSPGYYFIGFFFFVFIRMVAFHNSLTKELLVLIRKKGVIVITVICAATSLMITSGLYYYSKSINTQRIRERVIAIAATAAPDINGEETKKILSWQDSIKPEYEKLINQLNSIRDRNPDIVYAYIMRPTNDINFFEFVVDADSINLNSREDLNEDGLVNDMVSPGQLWLDPYPQDSAFHRGLIEPTADNQPTPDLWGVWISGHAPIRDNNDKVVAVLGVDMFASDVEKLTKDSFNSIKYFSIFFTLLLGISYVTFIKSYITK
ncbi:MAG: hypothetical protein QF442_02665 [Candidatus Peribacteraceae bacterium]|nr:hypothetical protein [Candidatus Peribacteraceae bacterium]